MKRLLQMVLAFAFSCGGGLTGFGAVLVDDHWEDGDRTDTNLPEEAAWFASSASGTPTLSAAAGLLTGNVLMFGTNTASRLWVTHFTPAGSPVELGVGDTLNAVLWFTASNVTTAPATSRGFRVGLFNFSEPGAAQVSADGFSTGAGGGAPGANVTGYLLNMNFAQAFTTSNPLQLMKRTDTTNVNLMGASGVFATLSNGGGPAGTPGISNGVPYRFEFSVTRLENAVAVTTRFADTNGWSIEHTAMDAANPNVRFDGFAIRPNAVADTAEAFAFSRFTVERIPFEPRITSLHFLAFDAEITWTSLPNRRYDLEVREEFSTENTWRVLGTYDSTGQSTAGFDPDYLLHPRRYYRVVQLP